MLRKRRMQRCFTNLTSRKNRCCNRKTLTRHCPFTSPILGDVMTLYKKIYNIYNPDNQYFTPPPRKKEPKKFGNFQTIFITFVK